MGPFLTAHKWPLAAAAACSILGLFPLMGAPGFLILPVLDMAANLAYGRPAAQPTHYGDAAWPIAIGYSIAIPWLVFALYLISRKLPIRFGAGPGPATIAGLTFVVLAAVHALACYPMGHDRAAAQIERENSPDGRRERLAQALGRFVANDVETYYSNLQHQPDPLDVSSEFLNEWRRARAEPGVYRLTPERTKIMDQLEVILRRIQSNPERLTKSSIETGADWREVRELAARALRDAR